MSFALPPPLSPGAVVRVIAPSSPFDVRLVWRGLGWLSRRYDVRYERGIFARDGYLAGSDARRAAELELALTEPDVSAIICARGGYGASRFAHRADWSQLANSPRWVIGFSDVTALHVEAWRQGVATIHSCNLTALGRGDAANHAAFVELVERPRALKPWRGLRTICSGTATGPLVGGNLTVLHACAAAGRLRLPQGAVLLLEDVTELPYRLDRAATTLLAGGHLATVSGIVLGELLDCRPGTDGVTAERALCDVLAALDVPIVTGAPVGHGPVNRPFVMGAPAHLDARDHEATLHFAVPSKT